MTSYPLQISQTGSERNNERSTYERQMNYNEHLTGVQPIGGASAKRGGALTNGSLLRQGQDVRREEQNNARPPAQGSQMVSRLPLDLFVNLITTYFSEITTIADGKSF